MKRNLYWGLRQTIGFPTWPKKEISGQLPIASIDFVSLQFSDQLTLVPIWAKTNFGRWFDANLSSTPKQLWSYPTHWSWIKRVKEAQTTRVVWASLTRLIHDQWVGYDQSCLGVLLRFASNHLPKFVLAQMGTRVNWSENWRDTKSIEAMGNWPEISFLGQVGKPMVWRKPQYKFLFIRPQKETFIRERFTLELVTEVTTTSDHPPTPNLLLYLGYQRTKSAIFRSNGHHLPPPHPQRYPSNQIERETLPY